jgi:pimeloyl-ACP methyl ester carboxylesterase
VDVETRYAANGDATIAYQVVGESALDLLYIPGWFLNPEVVGDFLPTRRYLERLLEFVRLITVDKRGFGMSDRLSHALPTVAERVGDITAVADAEGLGRVSVMGTFEGGTLALLWAATMPERVSSVVLVDSFARLDWSRSLFGSLDRDGGSAGGLWGVFEDGEAWRRWFAPDLTLTAVQGKQFARGLRLSATPVVIERWLELVRELDATSVLEAIAAPVLVIHRTEDRVVEVEHARELTARLPNATYIEIPGADHVPWSNDLDTIVGEVEQFLTGTRRAPDAAAESRAILFTDIVGSTARLASMGDRAWKQLIEEHDVVAQDVLAKFSGRVIKATGDGLLAELPTSQAALDCATELLRALRALGIESRAAVHFGPYERYGDDVIGMTVNVTARLLSFAGAGEVVVSARVADGLSATDSPLKPLGERALKGVPGSWSLLAASVY